MEKKSWKRWEKLACTRMSARFALLLLLIHGNTPPTWPTTATLTSWHTLPYSLIATPSVLSHTTLVLLESALPSTPLSPLRTRGETSWSSVRRTLQHLPVLLTLWVWGGDYYVFSIPRPFSFQRGVWTSLIRSRSGVGISPFPHCGPALRAGSDMDVTTGRQLRLLRRSACRDYLACRDLPWY